MVRWIHIGAVLVSLACGGAAGSGNKTMPAGDPLVQTTGDELYADGQRAEQQGDLIRAEQYYSAALDAGADAEVVGPRLIDVCVRGQRYQAALSHASSQLQRSPDNWKLRYLIATLHLAVGDDGAAEEELRRIIREQPREALPVYAYADLLWRRADATAAREHYRRYLELEPSGAHASEARARLSADVVPVAPTSAQAALPGAIKATRESEAPEASVEPPPATDRRPAPRRVSPEELRP